MGQARLSRRVEAETFMVKDAQGRVHATLGVSRDTTTLCFYDKAGVLRKQVLVDANGTPGRTLFDAVGNGTVNLVSGGTASHRTSKKERGERCVRRLRGRPSAHRQACLSY